MINKIIAETGVKIDIEDDGSVYIATPDDAPRRRRAASSKASPRTSKSARCYTGKVVRIMSFGAFVELLPGKDGMIHISKLAKGAWRSARTL